jgi:hypothetical protein
MASEVSEVSRTDHPADLLKDGRLTNALVRLAVTASGAGCLVFAGYHAVSSPAPGTVIVVGFLVTGLVLLVLALASDPTSTPAS